MDPPAGVGSQADACGIVVCGSRDNRLYVLEDATVRGLSVEGWANRVAAAAARWGAASVVAEANNGGAMVGSVLKAADLGLKVRLVHASRGKCARAAMLYLAASTPTAGWKPVPVDVNCGSFLTNSRTANRKAVMGHAATLLTDDGVEVQLIDRDQWLNSCDEDSLTGGANLAFVGDELFQFADVQPQGAGRFRLTRLRRGPAETGCALADHAIGDLFLLISPASMQPITLPIRARGSTVTVTHATTGARATTIIDAKGREVIAQILAALQQRELTGT